MKVALTEQFLEDKSNLPAGLERKCRELLSSLRKIEAKSIQEKALPGWRLHKLNSSPFISLSLDMNYRVLCKIEGDTAFVHRVVKHDLADSARVNKNDAAPAVYALENAQLRPSDLFGALVSLGIPQDSAKVFQGLENDDQLIEALATADTKIANIALVLYETTGIVIPRTRFTLLQNDKELEAVLSGEQGKWDIYLHPSQRYIVNLPVMTRLLVSGSAGTGKTVCAWYRLQHLVQQKHKVGFACSSKYVLAVSKDRITKLLKGSPVDAYFLVPSSVGELLQLTEAVEHVIIDEGQEFATTWYDSLGSFLRTHSTGLTLFYDLNQLGGNMGSGDTKRYEYRLTTWDEALKKIPASTPIEFYINYRNSREIAEFYYKILEEALPKPIRSEVPVFESGEVVIHKTRDAQNLSIIIADVIKRLHQDYQYGEIGVVCVGDSIRSRDLADSLTQFRIPISRDLDIGDAVIVSSPRIIRGHERKAMIVCAPTQGIPSEKWGKAINSYIALSRAREKLVVIQLGA